MDSQTCSFDKEMCSKFVFKVIYIVTEFAVHIFNGKAMRSTYCRTVEYGNAGQYINLVERFHLF